MCQWGCYMQLISMVLIITVFFVGAAFAEQDINTGTPAESKRSLVIKPKGNKTTEKRVALVIGNSKYKTNPLKNPVNDAKAMAAKLKSLGFDVIYRADLSSQQIGSTLREFRSKLTPASVALIFYAGHGIQIKGENYLPTVDANIVSEEDIPYQSLAIKQLYNLLEESKTRMNIVFLDACRNNPYSRSFRSAANGLAKVEGVPSPKPRNFWSCSNTST
jgi:uncharacterized caspase-like protein